MRGSAASGEGIEDDRVFVGCDLEDAVDEFGGFWSIKFQLISNDFNNLFRSFLVKSDICPNGVVYHTILNIAQKTLQLGTS